MVSLDEGAGIEKVGHCSKASPTLGDDGLGPGTLVACGHALNFFERRDVGCPSDFLPGPFLECAIDHGRQGIARNVGNGDRYTLVFLQR